MQPVPWMTYEAIEFIVDLVQPGWRVFEWGSGGSSLFFLRKGCKLTTIEHEINWFNKVLACAGEAWDLRLITATSSGNPRYGSQQVPGLFMERYVRQIEAEPEGSIDLVCVDGRARGACIELAAPKVKHGGYLVLDNSERPRYQSDVDALERAGWSPRHFGGPGDGGHWRTSFWRKPCLPVSR